MIRTLRVQGMVLATAAALLGGVLAPAAARADGPGPRARPEPHGEHAARVVLRTGGPTGAVVPGRTYEWTFKMAVKGSGKSGKAVFRTTLPRSLAFVSGNRDCAAAGWTVECDLGAVRKGRIVTGAIRAKVSRAARPGQEIRLRGVVAWGAERAARAFPAVRVAKSAHLGHSKATPKKPEVKKPVAQKPGAKKHEAKKPEAKKHEAKKHAAKKPVAEKPAVKKPAAVRRVARAG